MDFRGTAKQEVDLLKTTFFRKGRKQAVSFSRMFYLGVVRRRIKALDRE